MPETKGRTLEQMDDVFKGAMSEQEEVRRKAIEREIMSNGRVTSHPS